MSDVITELAMEANDKAAEIARLKAENARLREQIDVVHMSRLLTENENDKLRELCADMLSEDMDQHWPEFTRRALELGVEVEQ